MFTTRVTRLTRELCDALGATIGDAESHQQFYWFDLDISPVVKSIGFPASLPLIFLRQEALSRSDMAQLRALLKQKDVFHRSALLVLFGQDEQVRQARRLTEEMRNAYIVDAIILGKQDVQRIVTAEDPHQALRSAICDQTDLTRVSPYCPNEPATKNLFFGRELEIRTIVQSIQSTSVAVLGGLGIGKTSVLHLLCDLLSESYTCYYLDWHPMRDYDVMFRSLAYQWPALQGLVPEPMSFHSVVAELRKDKPVVLMLDEIDALLQFDMGNDAALFRVFRDLSCEGLCRFIFSGERVLRRQLRCVSEHPLLDLCGQQIRLGYLESSSARQLITRPMGWMNIELRDGDHVVEKILDFSSRHPWLVQYMCHDLIGLINEEGGRFITPDHVQRIADSEDFHEKYLYTVWGNATAFERALTLTLEKMVFTREEIQPALQRWGIPYSQKDLSLALYNLEICSILERDRDTYRLVADQIPRIARESLSIETEIGYLRRQITREQELRNQATSSGRSPDRGGWKQRDARNPA